MHGLRELLLPLAALQGASERDRSLIAALELAALSGQPVALPPKSGRVSLRVKRAALEASARARSYQHWCAARPAVLDPEAEATELDWPFWEELPELGEIFENAGQRYSCFDILRESAGDGSEGDSLILALPLQGDEPDSE
jgi:hypothetical protein